MVRSIWKEMKNSYLSSNSYLYIANVTSTGKYIIAFFIVVENLALPNGKLIP